MTNVLVNPVKVKRAKDIVKWIDNGGATEEETRYADKFARLIEKEKKENRVEAVYRLLGGLVRTVEEEKVAKVKAKEAKAKLTSRVKGGKTLEELENEENVEFEDKK